LPKNISIDNNFHLYYNYNTNFSLKYSTHKKVCQWKIYKKELLFMELHEKIRLLRIQKSLNQSELSRLVGTSVVSIGCWENGTKCPSTSAIISLAKAFNVSTDYLLGVSIDSKFTGELLSKKEKSLLSNYRYLDYYGKKAVDAVCLAEKNRVETLTNKYESSILSPKSSRYIPKYITPSAAGLSTPLEGDDFEMILADGDVPAEADFAVRIQGNSMYPYINDGDTVYVKKDTELSVGDVGIFCVDGAMYCKQYYINNDGNLCLLSANPNLQHTNIIVSKNGNSTVVCYGKVLDVNSIPLPDYLGL
jgi:SOS-response transcriptional repressor LexA